MKSENDSKPDKKNISADELSKHQMRMRFGWDDLIEEMIQDGQERGAFDNLRGAGKPLKLNQNAYGSEWDLAHSLMKDNDIVPPWIDKRNRIVAEIDLLRQDIVRQWARYSLAFGLAQGKSHRIALALQWGEVCEQWEEKLGALNKKIEDFNLGRPSENLEIFKLRLDDELQNIGASRDLATNEI